MEQRLAVLDVMEQEGVPHPGRLANVAGPLELRHHSALGCERVDVDQFVVVGERLRRREVVGDPRRFGR